MTWRKIQEPLTRWSHVATDSGYHNLSGGRAISRLTRSAILFINRTLLGPTFRPRRSAPICRIRLLHLPPLPHNSSYQITHPKSTCATKRRDSSANPSATSLHQILCEGRYLPLTPSLCYITATTTTLLDLPSSHSMALG